MTSRAMLAPFRCFGVQ